MANGFMPARTMKVGVIGLRGGYLWRTTGPPYRAINFTAIVALYRHFKVAFVRKPAIKED